MSNSNDVILRYGVAMCVKRAPSKWARLNGWTAPDEKVEFATLWCEDEQCVERLYYALKGEDRDMTGWDDQEASLEVVLSKVSPHLAAQLPELVREAVPADDSSGAGVAFGVFPGDEVDEDVEDDDE